MFLFTFLFLFYCFFTLLFLFLLHQVALTFHTRQVNLLYFSQPGCAVEFAALYLFLRFLFFECCLSTLATNTRQRGRYYSRSILPNCCSFFFMYSANLRECQMLLCPGNHFFLASNQRRKSAFACFRYSETLNLGILYTADLASLPAQRKRFVARTSCSCVLRRYFVVCCCCCFSPFRFFFVSFVVSLFSEQLLY